MKWALSMGIVMLIASCGMDIASSALLATAAPTTGNRLAVTDTLRGACVGVAYGDLGIELLITAFEADRVEGVPKGDQLDLAIEKCREEGGASLDTDCLTCVAAVVDQIYGP